MFHFFLRYFLFVFVITFFGYLYVVTSTAVVDNVAAKIYRSQGIRRLSLDMINSSLKISFKKVITSYNKLPLPTLCPNKHFFVLISKSPRALPQVFKYIS